MPRRARRSLWSGVADISGCSARREEQGAGSAQLIKQNGIYVNAVQILANNGSNTYTIPALECTYVGSVYIDASSGQVSAYRTWGQSRKFGVWNAYNRVPIALQVGDSTSSWAYSTATIRPSNNATANSLITFVGLPEEQVSLTFLQQIVPANSSAVGLQVDYGRIGMLGLIQRQRFPGRLRRLRSTSRPAAGPGKSMGHRLPRISRL